MSKKSRWRGSIDKQHGKRGQALFKSTPRHLYHIQCRLPSRLSWEKPLLLKCQILEVHVNTLAADDKYPVLNKDNLKIPVQMQ